ncbi:hypothetical protein QBC40DRAFT_250740 [Triangularia verruculosa]|uniref:Uncharacterized protein n=1 Tax=Triangularia verruculosa TaxID=2587418 RepID=A0AAN6XQJ8_9PEZI|nr:hypothetical protein QBC40DRAFT_250740 [Triangularia verruculosa]
MTGAISLKGMDLFMNRRMLLDLVLWYIVFFVMMVIMLMDYHVVRQKVSEIAGPSLQEQEWGFGQVMALSTWVPAVLDFAVILTGNLKALKYRLPLGVNIHFAEKDKDDLESTMEMGDISHGTGIQRWKTA